MSKERIRISYETALGQLAFVLVLSYRDCADVTLEAKNLLYFIVRYLLKISIINETMLI